MSTKKIIETNRSKFEKWEEQLTEHYDLLNSFDSYSNAEEIGSFFKAMNCLLILPTISFYMANSKTPGTHPNVI